MRTMSQIRNEILKRMREEELTIYAVAKLLDKKVPQRTVYAFLSGDQDTTTAVAYKIMQVVGLDISKVKKRKGKMFKPKP